MSDGLDEGNSSVESKNGKYALFAKIKGIEVVRNTNGLPVSKHTPTRIEEYEHQADNEPSNKGCGTPSCPGRVVADLVQCVYHAQEHREQQTQATRNGFSWYHKTSLQDFFAMMTVMIKSCVVIRISHP